MKNAGSVIKGTRKKNLLVRIHSRMFMFSLWYMLCIAFFTPSLWADGLIVILPPQPRPPLPHPIPQPAMISSFPLEVSFHHVEVAITEQSALTAIDQEFINPTDSRLEGYYLFPIPDGAAINSFSMVIDGKETPAELLDATKAKAIYEELLRKMIDPALLEYYGQGLFKVRIFPIEPRSAKKIKLSYSEVLGRNNGTIAYTYPLNTEKFSSKPLRDMSLRVKLATTDPLKNIYCTSHQAEIVRTSSTTASIGFEGHNVKPDKDFNLFFSTDKSQFSVSLLSFQEKNEPGYFYLNISPDYGIKSDAIEPKDIIFVLDASGSMAGKKLEQAQKALLFCTHNLGSRDRFEIIRFSTEAEALFGSVVDATKENITKAESFIQKLSAMGGTNIEEALTKAIVAAGSPSRPSVILFVTDGKPTIGKTDTQELLNLLKEKNSRTLRIFTCGIGEEINTHLLDKITELTKAYRTYIGPDEDMEVKISDLYTKIQSPILTDISIEYGSAVQVGLIHPATIPDLFHGSSLTVLGTFKKVATTDVVVKGMRKGKPQVFEYRLNFNAGSAQLSYLGALWANRRIAYLLDQIRLNGQDRELVDEVTTLAKKFGIITPYTSYLVLEDEQKSLQRPQTSTRFQGFLPQKKMGTETIEKSKGAYSGMREESGVSGIAASKSLQQLQHATTADDLKAGVFDGNASDSSARKMAPGSTSYESLAQTKLVKGRAFYFNGTQWMDSSFDPVKQSKPIRIQYGSLRFVTLLQQTPSIGPFLSLGKNLTLVIERQVYEIFE